MERVSIFIDGENFLYGIKSLNSKYSEFKFDFDKYIKHLTKDRILIDVYYVIAPLKQEINLKLYQEQQKLLSRLNKNGIKIVLCKRTKRDNENGTLSHKIKEDDIRLALQMQKDAYEDKFDTAILFGGDGDFVPLNEFISEKQKKMEIVYFKGHTSYTLLRICNFRAYLVNKNILNKFFYRKR